VDGTDDSAHQVAPIAGYGCAHRSTAEYARSVARQAVADVTPVPPRFDATDPPVLGANPFVGLTRGQIAAALGRLLQRVVVEPGVAVARALDAAHELVEVAVGRSDVAPARGDKRFTHPAWSSNPLYRRLLQAYLVERRALLDLVDDVDLDPKSRERARFAMSLFTEAAAPTNTLAGNPSALAKGLETRGGSLVIGLRHFADDVRNNGGMPSTVDTRPFTVGENLAITPGAVIHRSDVFELVQYAPSSDMSFTRPLVAIPPQINKFYITDIAPGRSLIEHTVAAGVPYFAVSWRNPTPAQRDWNLDTYVGACKEAVEVACDVAGSTGANVLGACAGGITMACLLGHVTATGEELINAATFLVAGVDTSVESMVGMLVDGKDLARVFAWLRPNDLVWNYWVEQLPARPESTCVRHPLLERRHHAAPRRSARRFPGPVPFERAREHGRARSARDADRPRQGHVRRVRRGRFH
jgi:polyhydroxyalkanoate synthase subunit PhaC